jgi:hypothetical protein
MPCIAGTFTARSVPGESTNKFPVRASITIDADGAVDSKVLMTLTIYNQTARGVAAATDTYAVSGAAAKVDMVAGAASASVLKEALDLFNEIPGVKVWAMHAPHQMSLNTGFFINAAEKFLGNGMETGGEYPMFLYRDVSAYVDADSRYATYMRVGLPEPRDGNAFQILNIFGVADSGARLRVYRDTYRGGAEEPTTEQITTAAVGYEAQDKNDAPTVRGPVLIEISNSVALINCSVRATIIQNSNRI